jgi:hypothetical protein
MAVMGAPRSVFSINPPFSSVISVMLLIGLA